MPRFNVLSHADENALVALLQAENSEELGAPHVLTQAEREVLSGSQRKALFRARKAWTRGAALHRFMCADGDRAVLSRVADFLRFELSHRDVHRRYYDLSLATFNLLRRNMSDEELRESLCWAEDVD